jgi:ArsR family transcriptional regulator
MAVDVDPGERIATLKALAEPVRLEILERLAVEELCVCHLVDELGLPQPLVSHHLKVLRAAGLVSSQRFRQWTYYGIRTDALASVADELGGIAASAAAVGGRRRPCC